MNPRQLGALVRLAGAMPGRLRRPLTPELAELRLREQMGARAENFLSAARRLIYDHPGSPYHRLLAWAGCAYPDLEAEVRARGLEPTLLRLRDAGVAVTLEEFKGKTPIVRSGLTIETRDSDFDSPGLRGDGIRGTSSGTRSVPTRVLYDWNFLVEEAAYEAVLYRHHGVHEAAVALWYPVLPGVAGLHNLLLNLMWGAPPERWFSQVDPAATSSLSLPRLSLAGLRVGGWLGGQRVPAPEFADARGADRVLEWLAGVRRRGRNAVLRTFVSSAVGLAERARSHGSTLEGLTLFAGGEPLTAERRAFLEAAGCRVVPRYVATEPGLIGAACTAARECDELHVYLGRLALLPAQGPDHRDSAGARERLLYTTLTITTPKVLLNTDLGDAAVVSTRECGCPFGRLGFDRRLSRIGSLDRLTLEGMTVTTREFEGAVAALLLAQGGAPDAFQYRQESDPVTGRARLRLALAPGLGPVDPGAFLAALYDRLSRLGPGPELAAQLWRDAGTVVLTREEVQLSAGAKRPGEVRETAPIG